MGNDWFHEYFINELKAIGRKPTSNMQHEVVDSLPSSGNEQIIYFVKNDSSSSNNHYDEYVWISSSNTFEKIGSTQIDDFIPNPSTAKIGQTIVVKEADKEGKPIAWKTADFPEQVQPDWNQNDDTQPDYVKNRPFYTGDPIGMVFVEESTIPFADAGYGYLGQIQSTFVPTIGETYKVTWDGIDYECACIDFGGKPTLGDIDIAFGEPKPSGEPFLIAPFNSEELQIIAVDTSASHTFSISSMTVIPPIVKIDRKYLSIQFKPKGESYLTFSSPNEFTLNLSNTTKHWDGTIEYFASDETWTVWDGTSGLSAITNGCEYVLYLRGTGNTVITESNRWCFNGTDIKCIGNIENLLDYATVKSGAHPNMSNYCYSNMFERCTSLTQAPALPATTLANHCYSNMFERCTSLTQAPALPATTLVTSCYAYMFNGCTSLTQAPALPATALATSCYENMFRNCTNLTHAPILPATTLATSCYEGMFFGCTSLKLSTTQTDEYIQEYRVPFSGNGTTVTGALSDMFASTGGTFTGTPSINTTYYLSSNNMIVRETEIATLNDYVGSMINNAISEHADTAEYIIHSSTEGSTKKFKITVDDTGTISATEVI